MSDLTPTPEVSPDAPAVDPTAAATPAEPKLLTLTQEQIDEIITKRLERERAKSEEATKKAEEDARKAESEKSKSLEDKIAELQAAREADLKAANERTITALLDRAVAGTHNPDLVRSLVRAQLGDSVDVNDEDAITTAATEFLAANPYLVKTAGTAAAAAPAVPAATPGVTQQNAEGKYYSRTQLEELKTNPSKIGSDKEILKKYLESIDYYATQG